MAVKAVGALIETGYAGRDHFFLSAGKVTVMEENGGSHVDHGSGCAWIGAEAFQKARYRLATECVTAILVGSSRLSFSRVFFNNR